MGKPTLPSEPSNKSIGRPLIMVILGVLIGGLVIGMYLPIFSLGTII